MFKMHKDAMCVEMDAEGFKLLKKKRDALKAKFQATVSPYEIGTINCLPD